MTEHALYLADARERVAATRAAGMLELGPWHDEATARALALITMTADRCDRKARIREGE